MKLFLCCGTYSKPDCLCDPSVLTVTAGSLVKALVLSLHATKRLPSCNPTRHPTDAHNDASKHYFTNTLYGIIFSITRFPFFHRVSSLFYFIILPRHCALFVHYFDFIIKCITISQSICSRGCCSSESLIINYCSLFSCFSCLFC